MLVFKAWRKSPALTQETTPSQRRITRILSDAQQAAAAEFGRNLTTVAELLSRGQTDRVVSMLPTEPWLTAQEALADELLGELLDAGSRVTLPAIEKATLAYSFDRERPESSQWARQAAGTMISQITGEQRSVVRDIVSAAALGEMDWGDVARQVQGSIGLTTQQAGWVSNRYDSTYLNAIRNGLNPQRAAAQARDAASRYQTAVHRYRANTIARTETMRAASEGRMQAWNQGITQGFIGANWQKEWIPESDACDICLGLRGKRINVKDSFSVGEPPAHPNCRCDVILVPPKVEPTGAGLGSTAFSALSTIDDLILLGKIPTPSIEELRQWQQAYNLSTRRGDDRSFREWFEEVIEPDIKVYADEGQGGVNDIPEITYDVSIEDMADLEKLYDDTFFTEEQKDAIWKYQDDGYSNINAWLRGQLSRNIDSREIEILDSIFAMAPTFGTKGWPIKSEGFSYYRYVDEDVLAGLKVGDRYVDNAYMYTSIDPDIASEYGRMDVALAGMRIIDNGSAPKISLSALTGFTGPLGDPEVIFYRGTPLTFLGKDKYGFYVFRAGYPDEPPRVPEWMDVTPPYMPDSGFKELGGQYRYDYFESSIYSPPYGRGPDMDAYDALIAYRGDAYVDINTYMRGELADFYDLQGSPYDDDPDENWDDYFRIEEAAEAMSELFKRIPGLREGIRVWRGITNIDYIDDLTPGTTFLHDSFMSTSLDRYTALSFGSSSSSNYVLLRINAPSGSKALLMPGTVEKEVLFAAGTVLKIIKTVKETHPVGYSRTPTLITVVYAEVIPT